MHPVQDLRRSRYHPSTAIRRFSSHRRLPRWVGISLQVAALLIATSWSGGSLVATLALSLWAIRSDRSAMQALAFTWLLVFMNPGIGQPMPLADRWIIIGVAGAGVHLRAKWRQPAPYGRILLTVDLFALFSAVGSLIVSYAPVISLLKLGVLWLAIRTVVIASVAARDSDQELREWFAAFGKVVILGSVPLLLFTVGFLKNGRGFQGLLNHPQAFGVFLAPWVAFFVGEALQGYHKRRRAILWLFVVTVLLISTGARTGALGALVGTAAVVLTHFAGRHPVMVSPRSRQTMVITVTALALVASLGVLFIPGSEDLPTESITWRKSYEGTVWEGFQASRGALIERSLAGFSASPYIGVGFGLHGTLYDSWEVTYVFGFPVGAPLEKGFAITALLEETGLVGLILFLTLLWALLKTIARSADPSIMGITVAALATNFGESTLLSAGGMGLYVWLLIGLALSQSHVRRTAGVSKS